MDTLLYSACLSQAHTGTTPVVINEFYSGVLQGAPYRQIVGYGHRGFLISHLSASDGGDTHGRPEREIFSAPADERTRSPNLSTSKRSIGHLDTFRRL
jgi:hypothetical protein